MFFCCSSCCVDSPGVIHQQGRWSCRCWTSTWRSYCSPSSSGSCRTQQNTSLTPGLDSVWTCGPDCPSRPPVDLLEAWFIVSVSVLTGSRSFELKNVLQIWNFCWEKLIKSVASPTKNTALVLFINNDYFHSVFLTKTSQSRTNMRGFTSYKTSVSQ